ncbi:MAG: hypothetical protein AAB932_04200 [Patescibacteria group bacterium]
MSEVNRKKGESFESFMRRTKRLWQRSGKMLQAKKIKFFIPKQSRNVRRNYAVKRAQTTSKMNYLRKIGKLPAEENDSR